MDLLRLIFDWHFNGADVALLTAVLASGVLAVSAFRRHAREQRPTLVVDRYGPVIELQEDGRWYRDGQLADPDLAAGYEQAFGCAAEIVRRG